MSEAIRTDRAPRPVGAYPHARRVGNLLFLSGVGPRDALTNAIPGNVYDSDGHLTAYDIEAQCRSVFANVRTILEASGAHSPSGTATSPPSTNTPAAEMPKGSK